MHEVIIFPSNKPIKIVVGYFGQQKKAIRYLGDGLIFNLDRVGDPAASIALDLSQRHRGMLTLFHEMLFGLLF